MDVLLLIKGVISFTLLEYISYYPLIYKLLSMLLKEIFKKMLIK